MTRRRSSIDRDRPVSAVAAARRQPITAAPPPEPEVEELRAPFEPVVEGLADIMPEPPAPLDPERERLATPRQTTGRQPESIIDPTDRDALRKAVLHYEILGKPLALRDMPERSTGF